MPPNELTLEHRARVVGWMHALDQKSASLIGQARLLGLLHDPIVVGSDGRQVARADRRANARYDALDDFVRLHRAVYGISSAQSILKNQIGTGDGSVRDNAGDNAGAYRRLSRMIKRVRDGAPFIRANTRQLVVPLHVLQRVAGDEVVNGAGQPDINLLSQGELAALRWAADALLDRVEGADEAKPAEPATNRRAKSYMPLFDGDRTGIDDEALAAAVERLRRGSS